MTTPSYDECLVDAELRARACYAEPGRHYHDMRHLDECEQRLDSITDLEDGERRILRWALLWHDAIYDATKGDNEERSAEMAQSELSACGIDEDTAGEVARLILLTKGHKVESGDRLGALMVSIDLSILGASRDRYREYATDVRQEYSHVPEEAWQAGRSAVLRALMDGPIFAHPEFRGELEAQARTNMEDELTSLAAG